MERLPRQCNYLALGAARIGEIKSIVSKLENCEHGGRAFQKLPRHMQRRAVSSNPQRLPRYLREKHVWEGGGKTKPKHRPRRKYRRRPSNLLQEYNRRQKEYVWLETHIWHAKRFHMRRQWGYALPDTPTCRGHRASLRAATTGCLLQDVSYLCCIELEGAINTLLPGLSRAMQPESRAVLTSSQVLAGRQWVSFMFFQPGRQPYGALTEVDLLFHPPQHSTEAQEEKAKLWLWSHPSAYTQVVEALAEIFQLEKDSSCSDNFGLEVSGEVAGSSDELGSQEVKGDFGAEEIMECKEETLADGKGVSEEENGGVLQEENTLPQDMKNDRKKEKLKEPKNVNVEKLKTRNIPFKRTPKYVSGNSSVVMTLLKDTLNRFKLLGPRSYTVLSSVLLPASMTREGRESEEPRGPWWEQYFGKAERLQSNLKQVALWKQLATCPHPSTKLVLPLTVRDPRITLPTKKMPMQEEALGSKKQADLPDWPVESALYSSDLRDQITLSKEPDAVLNQRRSRFLIPGSHLPETPQEARLPILLLSQPPSSGGLGSGWEVVIPAGWGMSVFLPLVFNGGVVNGQREAEKLHLEALTALPPYLLPDTPAGDLYSTWLAAERHKEFFKRPPANRHNYIKLGVHFPFSSPWRRLVQAWQPGISDFFVLRDSRLISCLSHLIENAQNSSNKMDEKGIVKDDSSINSNTGSKPTVKTEINDYSSSNGKPAGKRKADIDWGTDELKKAKHECPEETHKDKMEESETVKTCKALHPGTDGIQELTVVSPACLVMVQLVLAHKGSLEPCAMICLPMEEDFLPGNELRRPRVPGEALAEPLHEDPNHDRRARMREEHLKITARMRRVRRKARQRVTKEMDFESAAHSSQSVKEATSEALRIVEKENKVILVKHSSYKEEMESAWLMSASDPLQCCARQIMGYITHGTFSYTHGRAAGIGWVGLKPLLGLLQQCREDRDQKSSLWKASAKGKGSRGSLPVLVRNPSSLQYRWGQLSVVESSCLHISEV